MSKQTGAHTHEEKGKNVPVILFLQDWLFSLSVYFREHALSEKYSFLISCYFSWLSYYWEGFGDTYRDTKTIESFRLIFIC